MIRRMKMIVKVKHTEANDYGEGQSLEIKTPKYSIYFGDMEPEDASIARDLNDVLYIEDMIQEAYEAGKAGEDLVFEELEDE